MKNFYYKNFIFLFLIATSLFWGTTVFAQRTCDDNPTNLTGFTSEQYINNQEQRIESDRDKIEELGIKLQELKDSHNTWYFPPAGVGGYKVNNSLKISKVEEQISALQEQVREAERNIICEKYRNSSDPEEQERLQSELQTSSRETVEYAQGVIAEMQRAKAEQDSACLYWFGINITNCALQAGASLGTIITHIFGSVLWLAGQFFDMAIEFSITSIRVWFSSEAISTVWRIFRDLANLCFVFILLYIAIGTVFELQSLGDPKKLIVNVIIIALLVNFSGFFTRIVIDTSNIIAYEFYSQLKTGGGQGADGSISWRLIEKLKIKQFYVKNPDNPQSEKRQMSFMNIIIQTFGNVILILATAFVLLAASVLFLIRTLYLLFLYVLSPLAFVSRLAPSAKFNYFDKWLDTLIKQAFFAPAFLIPLYVVFLMLDKGSLSTAMTGLGRGSVVLIMFNILTLGLIASCLVIATRMGAIGSSKALGWGKKIGWGAAFGAAGAAGAYAIGGPASRLARSQKMEKWSADSRIAMGARRALNTLSDYDFGTGQKGYQSRVTERQKGQQERASQFTGPNASENRASYMSRLRRVQDRDAFYKGQSDEDKATIEQKLREQGKGAEADRLLAQVGPGKAKKAVVAAWKGLDPGISKGKRLDYLKTMGQDQFNNLYEGLEPKDRAELSGLLSDLPPSDPLATKLQEAKDSLKRSAKVSSSQKAETAREEESVNRLKQAKETLFDNNENPRALPPPTDAFNPNHSDYQENQEKIEKLRKLNKTEFANFATDNNLFDGSHEDIYPYLTRDQLRAIHDKVTEDIRAKIKEAIRTNRGNNPHPDSALESSYQALFGNIPDLQAF